MRIAITGSSGLLGTALRESLSGEHDVTRMVRWTPREGRDEVKWDHTDEAIDTDGIEGVDAMVHLAGESIAGRWTERKKRWIRESRTAGTRFLAERLAGMGRPPKVLVCASAVGYYGDRGDEPLPESTPAAQDFLGQVCVDWEEAADPARRAGIRVVHLRFGIVLSSRGGALARMLLPFKLGLGGRIGSGEQVWSWIGLDDAVAVIRAVIDDDRYTGPINAVTPNPVPNRKFTKTLGRVLGRPTIFPMPAFAARLLFGEMADALLLASARAEPARLKELGFVFMNPDLEPALRHALGRG